MVLEVSIASDQELDELRTIYSIDFLVRGAEYYSWKQQPPHSMPTRFGHSSIHSGRTFIDCTICYYVFPLAAPYLFAPTASAGGAKFLISSKEFRCSHGTQTFALCIIASQKQSARTKTNLVSSEAFEVLASLFT
jgi:hypothetical protein